MHVCVVECFKDILISDSTNGGATEFDSVGCEFESYSDSIHVWLNG